MKIHFLFAAVLAAVALLATAPVSAQDEPPCGWGLTACWWVIQINDTQVASRQMFSPLNQMCAATYLDVTIEIDRQRVAGLEIWGGVCPGGPVLSLYLGAITFRGHMGEEVRLDFARPLLRGQIGEPGNGVFFLLR